MACYPVFKFDLQHLSTSGRLAHWRTVFLDGIASLAVRDTVLQYTDQPVHIKWPNDIYVGRRKLGGILIENKLAGSNIRASVIGIGLNILETAFPTDLQAQAVSFRQLNRSEERRVGKEGRSRWTTEY